MVARNLKPNKATFNKSYYIGKKKKNPNAFSNLVLDPITKTLVRKDILKKPPGKIFIGIKKTPEKTTVINLKNYFSKENIQKIINLSKNLSKPDFTQRVTQSIDLNALKSKTLIPIRNSEGAIVGVEDTLSKQTIRGDFTLQQISGVNFQRAKLISQKQKIRKSIIMSVIESQTHAGQQTKNMRDLATIERFIIKTKLAPFSSKTISNLENKRLLLTKALGLTIVDGRSTVEAAKYDKIQRVAVNLAKKGFVVPSDILLGARAGFGDWKTLLLSFGAGAGFELLMKASPKIFGKRLAAFGTKVLGKVAWPLLIYQIGNEYRILKGRGESDAFALTKAIATMGGFGLGAVAVKTVSSKQLRVIASKSITGLKKAMQKPISKTSIRSINSFLTTVNPVRTYSLVFNARSGTFRRVDTKTGKTITTIISRLNSFLKYGNSEITRLKTTPPSRALAVIKKQSSQTRAYINYLQKAIPIARTYLIGYKQILKPKSFNSDKKKIAIFLRRLNRSVRDQQKLSKGLLIKAPRGVRSTRGGRSIYYFKDLSSGVEREFTSRKMWIKALKLQEKRIRAGKVKVPTTKLAKWLNIMNKKNVVPIFIEKHCSHTERDIINS